MLEKYLNKIYERDQKILNLLSSGKSVEELIGQGIFYRKLIEPKEIYIHFERIMLNEHLNRLLQLGIVVKTEGGIIVKDEFSIVKRYLQLKISYKKLR
jgi:hypothetical protein